MKKDMELEEDEQIEYEESPVPEELNISNIKNGNDMKVSESKEDAKTPPENRALMAEKPQNFETRQISVKEWFSKFGWSENPFTLSIYPSLFVGYHDQTNTIMNSIYAGHKMSLVLGPTGSGKTTLLKWIENNVNENIDIIYISKMPEKIEEFVDIFNEKYKSPLILRWFIPNIKNIYQLPEFISKKTKNKRIIVMCDEIHESNHEVLEWLRVLSDQIDHMSLLLSGLPVFDNMLREKLETFRKRITTRVELLSLTKEETRALIYKRIQSVGGNGIEPFTEDIIDKVFQRTGGFPREVLKACDDIIIKAISKGVFYLTPDMLEEHKVEEEKKVSLNIFEELTPLQRQIIHIIGSKECTPGFVVNSLNLDNYKTRQHAVRSINNILKRMMKDGLIERKKDGRAFLYVLAPKIRTLAVRA